MLRQVEGHFTVRGRLYWVTAQVHMGTTSARGDDPMAVVAINIKKPDGSRCVYGDDTLYALEELVMIEARTYHAG